MTLLKQHSGIYRGWVAHRRKAPKHGFKYPLFMMLLDLDELPFVFDAHPFWSIERRNIASFRRRDYLGDPATDLKEAVHARIREAGHPVPDGAVRLLTHIRYFGYSFNPVSFYYCYNKAENLRCIVAEITNTPWDERHSYVLPVKKSSRRVTSHSFHFKKEFHVSPFLDMDYLYDWRFGVPGRRITVHMKNHRDGEVHFNAALSMTHQPLTRGNLSRILIDFPLMTASVVFKIYWQAFLLWFRKATFFTHPNKRTVSESSNAPKSS